MSAAAAVRPAALSSCRGTDGPTDVHHGRAHICQKEKEKENTADRRIRIAWWMPMCLAGPAVVMGQRCPRDPTHRFRFHTSCASPLPDICGGSEFGGSTAPLMKRRVSASAAAVCVARQPLTRSTVTHAYLGFQTYR